MYFKRGIAQHNQGKVENAFSDYTQAIRLDETLVQAYVNRGDLGIHTKAYDQAVADYSHAIEINPELGIAYYNRGMANRKLGNHEAAIADYNEAKRLQAVNSPNVTTASFNR